MPEIRGFEPCPEYSGLAVCVDQKEMPENPAFPGVVKYRYIFEVDSHMEDGRRFTVASKPWKPSPHKRSNLHEIITQWTGQPFPMPFTTESMIGQTAKIVVIHTSDEGKTYANIASYKPTDETLKPSGDYKRASEETTAPF